MQFCDKRNTSETVLKSFARFTETLVSTFIVYGSKDQYQPVV